MNLLEKVSHIAGGAKTITEWLGEGGATVDQETAQRRTNTCLQCELNQPGSEVFDAVAAAIKKTVELKNDLGLTTDGIKKLETCQLCLCPLRLKIFVPISNVKRSLTPKEFELAPAHCWMVTEK